MSIRHGLLALLERGQMYGYQLRAAFEESTGSTWPLNIGQVYTTLARLERDGLVRPLPESEAGQRPYQITDAGRRMFVDALWHFPDALILSREDFCMRLLYFEFLSREARERVIALREAYVQRGLKLLAGERRVEGGPYIPHEPEMAAFHRELLLLEQRLLDRYKQRLDEPCRIDGDGHLTGDFPA